MSGYADRGMTQEIKPHPTDDDLVIVTETYDLTHPHCPMVCFDMTVWPWVRNEDVKSVSRRINVRREYLPHYRPIA
jgi:hypothetical protein